MCFFVIFQVLGDRAGPCEDFKGFGRPGLAGTRVSKEFEGRGIGMKLVVSLLEKAEAMNCYKTILDCKKELIPFYERIGFKQESNQMRYNH